VGEDQTARVWDLATGDAVSGPIGDHLNGVNTVAAATVGETPVVVTGSADRTARVTDVMTGACLAMVGEPAGTKGLPMINTRSSWVV
jgi:WD40 repeat protein